MIKLDQFFDPIINHHLKQMSIVNSDKSLPRIKRAMEYNTVRLGVGRQMGHSAYIARSASVNDLILSLNQHEHELMSLRCGVFGELGCSHLAVCTNREPFTKYFDRVWVDNASYVMADDLNWIYDMHAQRGIQFILIG